jgi:hypothetical protein
MPHPGHDPHAAEPATAGHSPASEREAVYHA